MKTKFEYQFELLKQEIDTLQNSIRSYDSMIMEIKKWAVAVYSGFLAIKFHKDYSEVSKQNTDILVYAIVAIFLFWLIDSIFKSIQGCIIKRYSEIENFINSDDFKTSMEIGEITNIKIPDIRSQFKVTLRNKFKDIIKHGTRFHNHLLYLAMLLLTIILLNSKTS